jgi:hypothetical protein
VEPAAAYREKVKHVADDTKKPDALARLKEIYGEAQDLVSREQAYANLEWILGAKGDRLRVTDWDDRMIEVVTLWTQDLASELERTLTAPPETPADDGLQRFYRARQSVATRLRAATEGFAIAFRCST